MTRTLLLYRCAPWGGPSGHHRILVEGEDVRVWDGERYSLVHVLSRSDILAIRREASRLIGAR